MSSDAGKSSSSYRVQFAQHQPNVASTRVCQPATHGHLDGYTCDEYVRQAVHILNTRGRQCKSGAQQCTYLQVSNAVALPQLDLEHLQPTDICSQPGEGLLATATHTNQQGIPTW